MVYMILQNKMFARKIRTYIDKGIRRVDGDEVNWVHTGWSQSAVIAVIRKITSLNYTISSAVIILPNHANA